MITLLRRAIYGPAQCAVLSCQISSLVHTYVSTTVVDPAGNPSGPPAFVFDIDGVLIRGKNVIPAAKEAMSKLWRGNAWQYPVCFITNGGGVTEDTKAAQLSTWLGVPVHGNQVILSHTPMRSLAHKLSQQPVLIAGRGDVVHVAHTYGFQQVMTTHQIARAMPTALPFRHCIISEPSEPCPMKEYGWGTEACPIAAALVMTDPDDWYQDLQLLADVITSHGVPARLRPVPGSKPIELYFSNPDLLWANEHTRPRFGQGAFAQALEALHRELTGSPLPNAKWFGKPNPEPYRLAEHMLVNQAVRNGLIPADIAKGAHARQLFSGIYAVGDNPAADVRGAVQAGPPWVSVLVRTGVFHSPGPNDELDPAHIVVEDVAAAVLAVLHRSRSAKWHSMR
eukprot:jgi/Chrzof1/9739/Cz04g14030.t1